MKVLLILVLCAVLVKAHIELQDLLDQEDQEDYVESIIRQAFLSNVVDNLKVSDESDFAEQLYQNEYLSQEDLDTPITGGVKKPHRYRPGTPHDELSSQQEDIPDYLKSLLRMFGKRIPKWLKKLLSKFKNNKCSIPKPCKSSLPQDTRTECLKQRQKDILIARMWYQITDETKPSTILFPFKNIPWLNHTISTLQFYYALDPFESRYLSLFGVWVKATNAIRASLEKAFKDLNYFIYEEYRQIYSAFEKAIAALRAPQYFESYTDDPTYSDMLLKDDKWQDDDTFVQFLVAGICPWLIRRVTISGEVGLKADTLKAQLNNQFDWDDAVAKANEKMITVGEAIDEGRLFVLYHEDHNDVESEPDILDKNASDTRTMMDITSPITLFILNEEKELKIAAIQWDYKPESEVFTPESPFHKWLLARGMVSQAHENICQMKYHLGHMHYVGSVLCLTFRRHFSTLHPLYDVLKYHCEGMIPHITQAYTTLGLPRSLGHEIFAISHEGINKLSTEAYEERQYGTFWFDKLLKSKGLEKGQMAYNPFVEDGELIWNEIVDYAEEIVKLYYEDDDAVEEDKELQSYADEVSLDGKNGAGKFRGFPAAFTTRRQLVDFLVTLMWRPVIHATLNYNLAPVFMPTIPSKLYEDTQADATESFAHNLPDAAVTVRYTHFFNVLGHFRANRLMDYYDKVSDPELKKIVWKYYNKLQVCINEKLAKRNEERANKGQMQAQYLMPKYLTNSIHI